MSTEKPETRVNCPTCKKVVVWNEQSKYRPFCSNRCQKIDFGEWASESFSIPGTPVIPEAMDDEEIIRH